MRLGWPHVSIRRVESFKASPTPDGHRYKRTEIIHFVLLDATVYVKLPFLNISSWFKFRDIYT